VQVWALTKAINSKHGQGGWGGRTPLNPLSPLELVAPGCLEEEGGKRLPMFGAQIGTLHEKDTNERNRVTTLSCETNIRCLFRARIGEKGKREKKDLPS